MNGTRFIVRNMYDHSLDLEFITGQGSGQRILLPRIDLIPSDSTLPFSFTQTSISDKNSFCYDNKQSAGSNIG
ncbi:ATP-dependent DNA helicase PIF1 [Aphis craccivora]|uniref:ATP-dependent DNA helicase PIF1 n=1 Tax=Aphis craccivora TaxID=307492 RepID=A0A6G0YFI1_APHCR|nr:ATP-dependent DNA helicase PIF1 [Aphis craccivora]